MALRAPSLRSSHATTLAWGVVIVVAILHTAYYLPRVVDDLFISLRYAQNLARGAGAVYHAGERVEGYSSPPWMLAQAFGILVGADPVSWTKACGLASFGALLVGVDRFARERLGMNSAGAVMAVAPLALDSYVVAWSTLGLETPSFLALLVWAPVLTGRALRSGTRSHGIVAGLSWALLATIRPEGPVYAVATLVAALVRAPMRDARAPGPSRSIERTVVGVAVLATSAAFLLRRLYYGRWLTHVVELKGPRGAIDFGPIEALWLVGAPPAEAFALFGGLALLVLASYLRREPSGLAVLLACAGVATFVPADWMPNQRMLLPLYVLAGLGWGFAFDAALRRRSLWWAASCAMVPLAGGASTARIDTRYSEIACPSSRCEEDQWRFAKSLDRFRSAWAPLRCGDHLLTAAGDAVLVADALITLDASAESLEKSWFLGRDIGLVGFVTGARVFDTAGLFTPDAALDSALEHPTVVSKRLVAIAMARRPVALRVHRGWRTTLLSEPPLLEGYEPVPILPSPGARVLVGPKPDAAEIARRYERARRALPSWLRLRTLFDTPLTDPFVCRSRAAEAARAHERIDGCEARRAPSAASASAFEANTARRTNRF